MSTRVLSPGKAVMWAAFFNFVAAFGFGTAVAKTVGAGMVDLAIVTYAVIFAGLMGAIVWDLSRGTGGCRRARLTRSSEAMRAPRLQRRGLPR